MISLRYVLRVQILIWIQPVAALDHAIFIGMLACAALLIALLTLIVIDAA